MKSSSHDSACEGPTSISQAPFFQPLQGPRLPWRESKALPWLPSHPLWGPELACPTEALGPPPRPGSRELAHCRVWRLTSGNCVGEVNTTNECPMGLMWITVRGWDRKEPAVKFLLPCAPSGPFWRQEFSVTPLHLHAPQDQPAGLHRATVAGDANFSCFPSFSLSFLSFPALVTCIPQQSMPRYALTWDLFPVECELKSPKKKRSFLAG